jgi:4-hydroxybenzoate polyprenyltransferase
MHLLRLIRPINLVIIALTMYMMRWFIIWPQVDLAGAELQMHEFDFFLLVLSTMLIAGAGNIINDYFDLRVDRINKPEKVIVGRFVKRRVAMLWHFVFNFIAVGIGVYLAVKTELWWMAGVQFFSAWLLWIYSTQMKRRFLIGNVIIGILSAVVPLLVGYFEIPLLEAKYGSGISSVYPNHASVPEASTALYQLEFGTLLWFMWVYAAFAFFATLVREIQKDMADIIGDEKVGCTTIPIVWGMKRTKRIVMFLIISIIVFAAGILLYYLKLGKIATIYAVVAVILPLAISLIKTSEAQNRKQHLAASTFMKLAMGMAVLFGLVFYYLMYHPNLW